MNFVIKNQLSEPIKIIVDQFVFKRIQISIYDLIKKDERRSFKIK